MRAFVRAAAVAATLCLSATVAASAEGEFDLKDGVSSETIRKTGYKLKLSDGTIVQLIDAFPGGDKQASCLVHIPSLRDVVEAGLRTGTLQPVGTAAQSASLQVRQDPNDGHLWCSGAGSGCTIIIK